MEISRQKLSPGLDCSVVIVKPHPVFVLVHSHPHKCRIDIRIGQIQSIMPGLYCSV